MAQKHLKELLKEDQEPFYLKDYIADRTSQLKKQQLSKPKLHLKKPKPTSILCKNACFFSTLQNSPTKSPILFDFPPSPLPNKSPKNKVFLHVPAKTAALLLEAAIRVQTNKSKPKSSTHVKSSGLGLFGSMLKRLTFRKNNTITSKFETKIEEKNGEEKIVRDNVLTYYSSSPSCNGTLSSLDLESSSSGRSFENDDDDDEFEFANVLRESNDDGISMTEYGRTEVGFVSRNENGDYFPGLCLSPLSPFRFALHKSPSPELQSPVKSSPLHCKFQDTNNYEYESLVKFQEDEDEEDKEQNSPVSVLDPPFEDDYDGHEDDSYDVECSYAFVHRAHEELLHKLHRFEKLAELDPIELEKRMIEAEEEYLSEKAKEIEEDYDSVSFTFDKQQEDHKFMHEVIRKSGFQDVKKPGIKRLISDLIIEEDSKENASDEQVMKRICKRLESWKEVESNTIEMMVEMDLRTDISDWKNPREEFNKTAIDIEVAIFAILVEELIRDLA